MGLRTTLADLIRQAEQESDMENSSFIARTTWMDWANKEAAKLHHLLITLYEDYSVVTTELAINSSDENYALPDDFLKARKVFWLSGGERYRLRPFQLSELDRFPNYETTVDGRHLRYRIVGNHLWVKPKASASETLELWYIPQLPRMDDDKHRLSFPVADGWEDFVVFGMASRAAQREESYERAQMLAQAQEVIRQRIRDAAHTRDNAEPHQVVDIHQPSGSLLDPWGDL